MTPTEARILEAAKHYEYVMRQLQYQSAASIVRAQVRIVRAQVALLEAVEADRRSA